MRWDTEPPGQVNPEKVPYAAELDKILVPDEEDRMLRPGPAGYWTEVVAYDRMNTEPPGADCRDSDLPVMLVNNGRREASHVIRHDPRWAVADCEAKLAILDEHRSFDPASDWLGGFCATCGEVDHRRVAWPCRTVRLLGYGYWAPSRLPGGMEAVTEGPERAAPLPSATFTPAMLGRFFAGLWDGERCRPPAPGMPPDPFCTATLFAIPDPNAGLRRELIATGTPVHPRDLPYLAPVQGPAPLACALSPHPEGTWHRDGRGTWFR